MDLIVKQENLVAQPVCKNASVSMIFPVPFITLEWNGTNEFNRSLKKLILYKRTIESGIKISNQGGWHSKQDLLTWDDACMLTLKQMIEEAISKMLVSTNSSLADTHVEGWEMEVWANVNTKGSSNISHDHTRDGNQWSGVYYVETGDDGTGNVNGKTIFEDKYRTSSASYNRVPTVLTNNKPTERNFTITPKDGLMVLFPGTLPHRVETYTGEKERITIAFNLKHKDFGVYTYGDSKKEIVTKKDKAAGWMWHNFRGIMAAIQAVKRLAH